MPNKTIKLIARMNQYQIIQFTITKLLNKPTQNLIIYKPRTKQLL